MHRGVYLQTTAATGKGENPILWKPHNAGLRGISIQQKEGIATVHAFGCPQTDTGVSLSFTVLEQNNRKRGNSV